MQLEPGTLLQNGKYRIIRTLGQGGFGITYEAEQVNLGRKVALKEFFMKDSCQRVPDTMEVYVPIKANRTLVLQYLGKFIREAKLIASLDHPHVVRVLDVFKENGTAYYVMDNLVGGSLRDKVAHGGPLSEAEAERYVRQVAEVLQEVHAKGMLHLDVKPSNILLNAKGEAVLIDFGIAKHYGSDGEPTSSTPLGLSRGFAPLEQGLDGNKIGPSMDIYSLGATLYYLVCGRVPPDASIVNEDGLARPKGISDRLWHVIERSMQPRRKDRPQSIASFLELFGSEPERLPEQLPERTSEPEPESEPELDLPPDPRSEETLAQSVYVHAPESELEPEPEPAVAPEPESPPEPPISLHDSSRGWGRTRIWATLAAVVVVIGAIFFLSLHHPREKRVVAQLPAAVSSGPVTGEVEGHRWVDLGLSVKWAECNVGASVPGDFGTYFAWAEVSKKKYYTWENLKYWDASTQLFSKYGTVDGKMELELSDDAAHARWGGTWRMPTFEEIKELREKCTWEWSSQNSRAGYRVTSKVNGASIFLPTPGCRSENKRFSADTYGYYWSSSLNLDNPEHAMGLYFTRTTIGWLDSSRQIGRSVRPVTE